MEIIPGIPDDVALECLIRVPHDHLSSVSHVCRRWTAEIQLPEFWKYRKTAGQNQPVIVMVQARVDPSQAVTVTSTTKSSIRPFYRLTICEPETGKWSELPSLPRYSKGLPMFCRIVSVGLNLVLIGGWDPVTFEVSNSVFVYNFLSAKWTCGPDMPGGPRSLFACASDFDRMVFVAGGHDKEKNALRSAWAYDVANNKWAQLPDMAIDRDECKGVFNRGKFHVIGGYNTEMQGQFSTSAEALDVATWQWDHGQDDLLETATCLSSCLDGGNGELYMCYDNDVTALKNSKWQRVVKMPIEVRNTTYISIWTSKMFFIGCLRLGEGHRAYVLDLKSSTWIKLETPDEYSGHVQSACWLDI